MENQEFVEAARAAAKLQDEIEQNHWKLTVLDERTDNSWNPYPTVHLITDRFAEVIQYHSCDAYVNLKRKDIKITLSGLVSLYNDYWND